MMITVMETNSRKGGMGNGRWGAVKILNGVIRTDSLQGLHLSGFELWERRIPGTGTARAKALRQESA